MNRNKWTVCALRPTSSTFSAAGRAFREGEAQRGGPRGGVLSHDHWLNNYAADAGAVGRNITLKSISKQIIGVMPTGFQFPSRVSVWIPIAIGAAATVVREAHTDLVIGRLHANATPDLAARELASIAAERVTGSIRGTLLLLAGIPAFLMLIGSANVSRATPRPLPFCA